MKRLLLFMAAFGVTACGQSSSPKSVEAASPANGVEVLSFHTKQRCPTCVAIEQLTREVVEADFAVPLADGSLTFRVVDISADEALADRYEVVWSSLLIAKRHNGAQSVTDLTKFAFANARTNPEKFKAELRTKINESLK